MVSRRRTKPNINYIWVGPPPSGENGGIGGHDIAGPLHMARVNSFNKKIFWCLDEYHADYVARFAGHDIEVKSIQSFLESDFGDEFLNEAAAKLRQIGRETLGWGIDPAEFARGSRRDSVSFKNVFSLFLLVLGGYTLDTNVRPKEGVHTLQLPAYSVFKMVKIPGQIECWMLYAPKNNQRARAVLTKYLNRWGKTQDVFKK